MSMLYTISSDRLNHISTNSQVGKFQNRLWLAKYVGMLVLFLVKCDKRINHALVCNMSVWYVLQPYVTISSYTHHIYDPSIGTERETDCECFARVELFMDLFAKLLPHVVYYSCCR